MDNDARAVDILPAPRPVRRRAPGRWHERAAGSAVAAAADDRRRAICEPRTQPGVRISHPGRHRCPRFRRLDTLAAPPLSCGDGPWATHVARWRRASRPPRAPVEERLLSVPTVDVRLVQVTKAFGEML